MNIEIELQPIKETTVEIDCAPLTPRPDKYFEYICKEILHLEYYEPISKFFGYWTWKVKYFNEEQPKRIKEYLTEQYNNGLIRYASW